MVCIWIGEKSDAFCRKRLVKVLYVTTISLDFRKILQLIPSSITKQNRYEGQVVAVLHLDVSRGSYLFSFISDHYKPSGRKPNYCPPPLLSRTAVEKGISPAHKQAEVYPGLNAFQPSPTQCFFTQKWERRASITKFFRQSACVECECL